ncbi:unnamed protein product [Brachionus calyciflorus]|uniref:Uncharacterized protein n=1 Tax=Brachionus calyciflorus TaxID=104777 RepID=A0A814M7U3_9BILA|nr:unnamed protein product [Brachionus calyciflorus]
MSIETSMPTTSNKTPTSNKTYKTSTNLLGSPSNHQSNNKSQFSLSKFIDRSNNLPNLNSNSIVLKEQFKHNNSNNVSYVAQIDEIKAVSKN